jgi:hypothetical protein
VWACSGISSSGGKRGWRGVDDKMSFMEHLGEVRTRIMRSLYCLLAGLAIAFPFSQKGGTGSRAVGQIFWKAKSPSCSRRDLRRPIGDDRGDARDTSFEGRVGDCGEI